MTPEIGVTVFLVLAIATCLYMVLKQWRGGVEMAKKKRVVAKRVSKPKARKVARRAKRRAKSA